MGHAVACYNLAKRNLHDIVDLPKAVCWMTEAANAGYVNAVCELGVMYRLGHGVPRSPLRAAGLHLIAAKAGDVVAMGNLADSIDDLPDLALSGSALASWQLCEIYRMGLGVEQSDAMAWTWIKWAKEYCQPPLDHDVLTDIDVYYSTSKSKFSAQDIACGDDTLKCLMNIPSFANLRGNTMRSKKHESGLLIQALAFAAHKHRDQRRKDAAASPYINHPIALADVLANEGEVFDTDVLCAALLHDTIEDTETTLEELREHFGDKIASIVMEVTDDKLLDKGVRKQAQIDHAATLSHEAKLVKLADKISNLRDILGKPPAGWSEERKSEYFKWAGKVVDGLRGTHPGLEEIFDGLMQYQHHMRLQSIVDKAMQEGLARAQTHPPAQA